MAQETLPTEARVEQMLRDAALDLPAGEPSAGFAAAALRRRRGRVWPAAVGRLAAAGAALAALWLAVRQPAPPVVDTRPAPKPPPTAAVVRPAPVITGPAAAGPVVRVARTDARRPSPRRHRAAEPAVRPHSAAQPSWKSEVVPVYEAGMITPAVVAERNDETGQVQFHPALMNIPIETDRHGRMMGVSGTPSVMPVSYSEETR